MARGTAKHKQLVTTLTVDDLRQMITEIVQKVVREQAQQGYYINAEGYKVLHEEEDVAPDYLRELNAEYEAIRDGRVKTVSPEELKEELGKLGVRV